MEEITYLDIVDLDESVGNRLVTESGKDSKRFWNCPHHIVEKVIKIIDEQIDIQKYQEEPKALQKAKNDIKSLEIVMSNGRQFLFHVPDLFVDVHGEDGGAGVEDGGEGGHEGGQHDRQHEAAHAHRHLLVHQLGGPAINDVNTLGGSKVQGDHSAW